MPFVQAKCESCGGILAVDDTQKAAICPFCNAPYVVQDAINNYSITNNITVGAGATVNIYGNANNDFEIEAGSLKKYRGASADVVIPDGVKEIKADAFKELSVESVILPNSVEIIGDNVFESCSRLKSITIPDNVESIGAGAFKNCTVLKSVVIPKNPEVCISVGREVFMGCDSLESIVIPDNVSFMGDDAFKGCENLKSITIGAQHLYDDIFRFCFSLREIKVSGPSDFPIVALAKCKSLETVKVNEDNNCYSSVDGILYNKDKSKLVFCPRGKAGTVNVLRSVKTIGDGAFCGCTRLKEINMPDSVESIGKCAFEKCQGLTSIVIPKSIGAINEYTFSQCSELINVSLPDGLYGIGGQAFGGCTSLQSIKIPDSVGYIWHNAFLGCKKLADNIEGKRKNQRAVIKSIYYQDD